MSQACGKESPDEVQQACFPEASFRYFSHEKIKLFRIHNNLRLTSATLFLAGNVAHGALFAENCLLKQFSMLSLQTALNNFQ